MVKGSDIANLSVLGYDPAQVYSGRSPLEAAGMGIALGESDVAFRCNLITLGSMTEAGIMTDLPAVSPDPSLRMVDFAAGHPTREESEKLIDSLREELGGDGIEFYHGVSYRHLVVWRDGLEDLEVSPPHDLTGRPIAEGWPRGAASERVLRIIARSMELFSDHPVNRARKDTGKKPVNAVWLWGQGKRPNLDPFVDRFGLRGAIITAVDLLRGLGISIGFKVVNVPGATGYLDTDYQGKAIAALKALEEVDLVYLHVEAPDEASHGGLLKEKLTAIENFDEKVAGIVLDGLAVAGPHRVLVLPDHATPLEIMTHSEDPVPFGAMDSEENRGSGLSFSEKNAAAAGLSFEKGHELMGRFIRWKWD